MTEPLSSREVLLTRTLVQLADTLVEGFDIVDLVTFLAVRCVEILDVAAAGLMLPQTNGELGIVASSSEAMYILEAFEAQSNEGPCPDCYRSGRPIVNLDPFDDVTFPLGVTKRNDPLKAYVTIIEGCNEFCSFCVVPYTRGADLPAILTKRIVILDGAMGTMIQRFKLTEAQYRGERYRVSPWLRRRVAAAG